MIAYITLDGDLTPAAVLANVPPEEAQVLGYIPNILELVCVLVNEVRHLREQGARRTRTQTRQMVCALRESHPDWVMRDIAAEIGISTRYAKQLWSDYQHAVS